MLFAHYLQRRLSQQAQAKLLDWVNPVSPLHSPLREKHCVISSCADSFTFIVSVLYKMTLVKFHCATADFYKELRKGHRKNWVTLKFHISEALTIYLDHNFKTNFFPQVHWWTLNFLFHESLEATSVDSMYSQQYGLISNT